MHTVLSFFFFLSGVAGLGYEILWTRMFAVSLGHEIVAMLAVLCAFFTGIALGAYLFDKKVAQSRKPENWYIGFELTIGIWAVVLLFLNPVLNPYIATLIGPETSPVRHWAVAFLYPLLLLLPATASMGGTLAAMNSYSNTLQKESGLAGLYGANTLGAMLGTLCTTFFLVPALGMRTSSAILALVTIGGALLFWRYSLRQIKNPKLTLPRGLAKPEASPRILLTLFFTGFLGIGFEILMIRSLTQFLENTVYTFASLLIVYLFGTSLGAFLYQRFGRNLDLKKSLNVLLQATAAFCLMSIILVGYFEIIFNSVSGLFGKGFWPAIGVEMVLACLFFLLPTMAMGATFSHLVSAMRSSTGGVGKALSINTLGAAIAPMVFGLWILPELGLKFAFLLIVCGYLLQLPLLTKRSAPLTATIVLALFYIGYLSHSYAFISKEDDESVLFHKDGVMAAVSVIEEKNGKRHLKVNNHFQMGGTGSRYSDLRQAQLPLLLHKNPHSALFLGLGTGITFSGADGYPQLQADGVELIPEVIEALPFFKDAAGDISASKNLHVIQADARRYVTATKKKYDVVIADLFHPSRDGAGSLYTVEHFRAIRNLLSEDGLFCQWLPLYQMDLDMVKIITRTFLEVFPEGGAYLAHYSVKAPLLGLVGSGKPLRYPERWYRDKLRNREIGKRIRQLRYDSFYSVFGSFLGGPEQLKGFSAGAVLNSDDYQAVIYQAPEFVYSDNRSPHERLFALVDAMEGIQTDAILAPYVTEEDYLADERLQAYWKARNSFLHAGAGIEQTGDVEQLYATIKDPLLAVIRQSLDFTAAYYPLLTIAYEMYPHDRDASYELLSDLMRANPMRPEASIIRKKIFEGQ